MVDVRLGREFPLSSWACAERHEREVPLPVECGATTVVENLAEIEDSPTCSDETESYDAETAMQDLVMRSNVMEEEVALQALVESYNAQQKQISTSIILG